MNGFIVRVKKEAGGKLDAGLIERAYKFARAAHEGQARQTGEPFFIHPCEVASILLDMDMDAVTIAAGLSVIRELRTSLLNLPCDTSPTRKSGLPAIRSRIRTRWWAMEGGPARPILA